jgi:TPR repeat protein
VNPQFERAAEDGHIDAMYNLGYLYAKSIAPPNIEEARRWLQRAADTGLTDSM